MSWILNQCFGRKLQRETERYLRELAQAPAESSRRNTKELLARLRAEPGNNIVLGETTWGEPVQVPLDQVLASHGLATGGTGSGKTTFALLILKAVIDLASDERAAGFGLVDPKGDLFRGVLFLLSERLEYLAQHEPQAAREFRRRIVIIDFSNREVSSSYNIITRWPTADADFFASNRADLLLDLLPGGEKPSLGGSALLRRLILLLSDSSINLPITRAGDILHDEVLRRRLVGKCGNRSVSAYFLQQLPGVPRSTVAALDRRLDALFSSEGVRLALSGNTAPDFRRFQDEGRFVLINCAGHNIARSVRQLLQCLLVSDIAQSVFCRRSPEVPFLWLLDEAQHFFTSRSVYDRISDLLTMARSFGSHFLLLTQNAATAVGDARMLKTVYTNIKWSFSMRGEPGDCVFLKPAVPVTGRRMRPQGSPFEEKRFYSLAEERAMALDEIAHLPDRVGYLWLKTHAAEAIKIKTAELEVPHGQELDEATAPIRRDPTVGMRLSRKEYERKIAERDGKWTAEEPGDLNEVLAKAYRQARGKANER